MLIAKKKKYDTRLICIDNGANRELKLNKINANKYKTYLLGNQIRYYLAQLVIQVEFRVKNI